MALGYLALFTHLLGLFAHLLDLYKYVGLVNINVRFCGGECGTANC
jgi:hypothetical protein